MLKKHSSREYPAGTPEPTGATHLLTGLIRLLARQAARDAFEATLEKEKRDDQAQQ